jgi:hypothetical protein
MHYQKPSLNSRAWIVLLCLFLLQYAILPIWAATHPEAWYQSRWCHAHQGQVEVSLPDGTRADCLTATHAIEVEFGKKWAESIGQSLYYAIQTNKAAGIVLILETAADYKYFIRLNTVVKTFKLPIDVWQYENEATPVSPTPTPSIHSSDSKFTCVKKTCKQITSCAEAKYLLKQCGYTQLDRDKDGVPCESICK